MTALGYQLVVQDMERGDTGNGGDHRSRREVGTTFSPSVQRVGGNRFPPPSTRLKSARADPANTVPFRLIHGRGGDR